MSYFENTTFPFLWKNTPRRASFSVRPKMAGNHNILFKGHIFSSPYQENEKVYVKCLTSDDGEPISAYMDRFEHARKMASRFNTMISTQNISGKVTFVEPACAVLDERTKLTQILSNVHLRKEENVVCEERLKGKFTKFISAEGNVELFNNSIDILDAFCHFSFIASEGKIVVCGLKGVKDKRRGEYRLTNPTIHSRGGMFGSKDMSERGIQKFLRNHICNELCHRLFASYNSETVSRIDVSDCTVSSPQLSSAIPLTPTAPFQELEPASYIEPPPPYSLIEPPPPYQLDWSYRPG